MKNVVSYLGLAFASSVLLLPQSSLANCLPKVTEVRVELPEEHSSEPAILGAALNGAYLAKFSIYGQCLGSSSLRAVLAQGEMGMFTPLTTEYQDENMLEVYLPANELVPPVNTLVDDLEPLQLPPGEYLLKVQYNVSSRWGNWWIDKASWDLTVGAVGPEGPPGPEGPAGPAGPAGAAIGGLYVVENCQEVTWDAGSGLGVRAFCEGGGSTSDSPISGGCSVVKGGVANLLTASANGPWVNNAGVYSAWECIYKMPSDAQGGDTTTKEVCATAFCLPQSIEAPNNFN
jgi:hypothetical protein